MKNGLSRKSIGFVWVKRCFSIFALTGFLLSTNPVKAEEWTNFLPIGKQLVVDAGFGDKLPLPIGLAWNIFWQEQQYHIIDSALHVAPSDILYDMVEPLLPKMKIDDRDVWSKNLVSNLKLDVWILPVWNVYTVVGYIEGDTGIDGASRFEGGAIELDPATVSESFLAVLGDMGIDPANMSMDDLDKFSELLGVSLTSFLFQIPISGYSYGIGTTIAGGYGNFFFALDINYAIAKLDISDSSITNVGQSIRLGWVFGNSGFSAYFGAMKMETDEHQKGWVNYSGVQAYFDIEEEAVTDTVPLFGVRLDFTKEMHLTCEYGYDPDKEYFVGSAEYRF